MTPLENAVFAKCAWRLIPFIIVLYVISIFDRVNVGFAALTMNRDLGFSPSAFGFGAAAFFLAFVVFSTPSSMMVEKAGARRWFFLLLAIWGLVSAGNAFIQSPGNFYLLRFVLGIAEAGFVPGLMFYLSLWFPPSYRARATAGVLIATPLSFVIGGPISSLLLVTMDGVAGLHGWQWLFLCEGLPATALAVAALHFLPDRPSTAAWLSPLERQIVCNRLVREDFSEHRVVWRALCDTRVLALGLINAGILVGVYGIGLWLPQIVHAAGFSNLATDFIVALPNLASMLAMFLWSRSSDIRGERMRHIALATLAAAAFFAVASITDSDLVALFVLSCGLLATYAGIPALISLPSQFLRGAAAAGATGLVYAIASLGAFLGPFAIGVLREQSGDYRSSMAALAVGLLLSAVAAVVLGRSIQSRRAAMLAPSA